jgi:peptide/nickel transport system substrate-binding protein
MLNHSRSIRITALTVFLVSALLLSACGQANPESTAVGVTNTPLPPTATPIPQKTLVVCIGSEPQDLYLYGESSRAKWSVLEAIYDGPIDTEDFEPVPVLLEELPTLQNGGVTLQAAPVSEGDPVANTNGDIVALAKGVWVFPAGCSTGNCAVQWDGETALELTQMVVNFKILPGVTWSDGAPLTADDSVFSYEVSADPATTVTKTNLDRTLSYTALDEQTVQWVGQPGYLTLNPSAFLWTPLPRHQLGETTAEQLSTSELTNRNPLGWGAYTVDEWVAGDHIRLVKNTSYYRAGEGLPYFDVLVYRFIPSTPEADLSMMVTGECDIIDSSVSLENQIKTVRELENQGELTAYFGMGPEWEGLNLGVKPASYDGVYNPYEDRQDFFGDMRVRQAIGYCLDRERIQREITLSQSVLPATYLPPNHPFAATGLQAYARNVVLGNQLLEETGWLDADDNPSSPRVSSGVENVFNGTELLLNYYVTESPLHASVREVIVESLADCGIGVITNYLPVNEMFASGPDGVVFGRSFDLAELAWSTGRQAPCFLYTSSEIPTEKNKWLGARYGGLNITGWSNDEYDAACEQAYSAGLDRELVINQTQQMQEILMQELPVIPLFFHVKVMVSRPDLCGMQFDVTARSALKNIETFSLADACPVE